MASQRHVTVGGVQVGGGAPVVVQTMTKTETANLAATMDQIRRVAEAGADIVRVAVPRDKDVEALRTIVRESPIPVIADIHFNHTLALKAIDAGAHCVRLNPGNIGGPEKVAEVAERATAAGVPMRIGVNSGSLPKHLHALERESPVEALVAAAVEFVGLMERFDFRDFKVSIKSTSVPNTIAANRLLSREDPLSAPPRDHRGGHEVVGVAQERRRPRDAAGRRHRGHHPHLPLHLPRGGGGQGRLGDPQGAEAPREGPVLIACPTCGRLQFDMDTVVADIERRLEAYADPIEVAVLGCAVNGIGEASHADFGITGAKNEGLIFSRGKPLKKVPQEQPGGRAVQGDRQVRPDAADRRRRGRAGRRRRVAGADRGGERGRADARAAREARGRARAGRRRRDRRGAGAGNGARIALDESVSPTDGRRFTRA